MAAGMQISRIMQYPQGGLDGGPCRGCPPVSTLRLVLRKGPSLGESYENSGVANFFGTQANRA